MATATGILSQTLLTLNQMFVWVNLKTIKTKCEFVFDIKMIFSFFFLEEFNQVFLQNAEIWAGFSDGDWIIFKNYESFTKWTWSRSLRHFKDVLCCYLYYLFTMCSVFNRVLWLVLFRPSSAVYWVFDSRQEVCMFADVHCWSLFVTGLCLFVVHFVIKLVK